MEETKRQTHETLTKNLKGKLWETKNTSFQPIPKEEEKRDQHRPAKEQDEKKKNTWYKKKGKEGPRGNQENLYSPELTLSAETESISWKIRYRPNRPVFKLVCFKGSKLTWLLTSTKNSGHIGGKHWGLRKGWGQAFYRDQSIFNLFSVHRKLTICNLTLFSSFIVPFTKWSLSLMI